MIGKKGENTNCYMKYSQIIWDFNGTILNDVDIGIKSANELLEKRGIPPIKSIEEYHKAFDFPIKDYSRRIGFDFSKEPYEKIADEWFERYTFYSDEAPAVEGVFELIEYFKQSGRRQLILSASERDILEKQLTKLGLSDKFETILACDNIYAHGKTDIAREFFGNCGAYGSVMLGDTTHDAEVARAIGAEPFLVACGHQSYEKLSQTGCRIFESMAQVKAFFETLDRK